MCLQYVFCCFDRHVFSLVTFYSWSSVIVFWWIPRIKVTSSAFLLTEPFVLSGVDPSKGERFLLARQACGCIPELIEISGRLVCTISAADWLLFGPRSFTDSVFQRSSRLCAFREAGGGSTGRGNRDKHCLFQKKVLSDGLLCKGTVVKTKLPIIALIISFLCTFAYFISFFFMLDRLRLHFDAFQKET